MFLLLLFLLLLLLLLLQFVEHGRLSFPEFKTWLEHHPGILSMFTACLHEEVWGLQGNALYRSSAARCGRVFASAAVSSLSLLSPVHTKRQTPAGLAASLGVSSAFLVFCLATFSPADTAAAAVAAAVAAAACFLSCVRAYPLNILGDIASAAFCCCCCFLL